MILDSNLTHTQSNKASQATSDKAAKAAGVSEHAYLVEMFSAIQGEGPIVGSRQIFIRFLGCHIQCAYCDTPATHTKQRRCRIESTPGQRDFTTLANPVPHTDLIRYINQLESFEGLHDSVSLTGGEPLQHIRALRGLIPYLKPRFPLYLETDGILFQNLEVILDDLWMIGMDFKLPSATGLQAYWQEHEQFLARAARKEVFVKLVLSRDTQLDEIQTSLDIIRRIDRNIMLILQPVTPYGIVRNPPTPEQMLSWQAMAKKELKNVRVIPQTHKIMGQI